VPLKRRPRGLDHRFPGIFPIRAESRCGAENVDRPSRIVHRGASISPQGTEFGDDE
jgi:hypothetical protein